MAIHLNTGFLIGSIDPIDERFVFDTFQDMKDYNENIIPDLYFCLNKQDKSFYIYDVNNTPDPVTGKWRKYSSGATPPSTTVYRFKGSVNTKADLPTTGNENGDVYDVKDTGMNYAWTDTGWDALGTEVDLSPYAFKEMVILEEDYNTSTIDTNKAYLVVTD